MRTKKATTAIILDRRVSIKGNNSKEEENDPKDKIYPVKLRITYDRKPRLFGINISLKESDWEKLHTERLRDDYLKKVRREISEIEENAEGIINKLNYFTFDAFTKAFNSDRGDSNDVYAALKRYQDKCYGEDRISTALLFSSTISSLKRFKSSLKFQEVTVSFLNSYELWMKREGNLWTKKGASNTSIGMYMRSLKSVVCEAVDEGIIDHTQYPFGKRKYKIPTSKNIKKALELNEIEKIFKYKFTGKEVNKEMARDLWVFSYLSNGMNMKDVCRLKNKDFHGDKFVFIRAKTEKTCGDNPKLIKVILTQHLKRIIEKWGNKDKSPESYVFPFLNDKMTAQEKHTAVKSMIAMVNRGMEYLFEKLGIDKKSGTYVARHSYSTVVRRKGGSTEFIQEALGHKLKSTTENYLDEFEDEVKKHYADILTAFDTKSKIKSRKLI